MQQVKAMQQILEAGDQVLAAEARCVNPVQQVLVAEDQVLAAEAQLVYPVQQVLAAEHSKSSVVKEEISEELFMKEISANADGGPRSRVCACLTLHLAPHQN